MDEIDLNLIVLNFEMSSIFYFVVLNKLTKLIEFVIYA
jgi:hypothetical protein